MFKLVKIMSTAEWQNIAGFKKIFRNTGVLVFSFLVFRLSIDQKM